MFTIDKAYTRKEIRKILGIPNPNNIGGIWSTGYVQYQDKFYIFATITDAGRTGHNYGNIMKNDVLYWYTKNTDHFYVPTIQKMTSGRYPVHIFTRYDSKKPDFFYQGKGILRDYEDGKPAFISWKIQGRNSRVETSELLNLNRKKFIEGKKISRSVNIYERDLNARKLCLKHYGFKCIVCGFDFESNYGEIGKKFIHVHHEKELSLSSQDYEIDPISDMKPVCPNCHSMLHRRRPAYSIKELKEMLTNKT